MPKPEPLIRDYRVGLVIPSAGINERQLAVVSDRLSSIAHLLPEDGRIEVYVPGFDLADAEATVARNICNMLERKAKLWVAYIPARGDHRAGVAHAIVHELVKEKHCDEVWCCPAEGQTAGSTARVAQVWKLAQEGRMGVRPAVFKQIPPWVEPPTAATQQPKKGRKSWRDMINKRSFHW